MVRTLVQTMYYHEPTRLVYLAHPRTASVATAATLKDLGFEKYGGDHHIRLWNKPRSDGRLPNPVPGPDAPVTNANRHEWTVFTTVRNHWDTAVSWVFKRYAIKKQKVLWSFENFKIALDYNGWVEANTFWTIHGNDVDVTLRFETLETDLRRFLAEHGIEMSNLQRLNVSTQRENRHYSEFYRPETRSYIYDRFGEEIERYGYVF